MVEETSKNLFKQKKSKFEKKNFLTFLSPQGVAQGYPLARPPEQNSKIASVRPPIMSKDTSMQNFRSLGLVDVSGDTLGSTFWLRIFNYEDSCKIACQPSESMLQFCRSCYRAARYMREQIEFSILKCDLS